MVFRSTALLAFVSILNSCREGACSSPNILFIVVDDVGWNDVQWNNPSMVTPHLDGLAREAIILQQFYALPMCTPSRSSLMTGRFPIHTRTQNSVIRALKPTGLSTRYKILPQYLKALGYKTHAVGKWHLGFCDVKYTPTHRGFDSFLGYYLGFEDYYEHTQTTTVPGQSNPETGYDFWNGTTVYWEARGKYSTDIFKEAALDIISKHPEDCPLFLYLAFQAAHGPLQVEEKFKQMCTGHKEDRKTFCGMMAAMDAAVGEIVCRLKECGLWDNTITIFVSDNGGDVQLAGNNYPLRGSKATLFEGGTRVPGFVHGANLPCGNYSKMIHYVDLFPTVIEIAGGKHTIPAGIDGVSHWATLRGESQASPRNEFVYNIYYEEGYRGAVRMGDYKLIYGSPGSIDGHYPPDYEGGYRPPNPNVFYRLFNLAVDPNEYVNLAESDPGKLQELLALYQKYNSTMLPADDPPLDATGRPSLKNGTFAPGWCTAQ